MEDGRIIKNFLYGKLDLGSRPVGRTTLNFSSEITARDKLATGVSADNWELPAANLSNLKTTSSRVLRAGKTELNTKRTQEGSLLQSRGAYSHISMRGRVQREVHILYLKKQF